MNNPIEPLELSAPLALQLAPTLCRLDPATGESCAWSHGLWQYLRLFGLVGSIEYHTDFYRQALSTVDAAGTKPRILISGAADYGLLARVIMAFRERGLEPDITVVDLCPTPLHLNRWYAERVGCAIEICVCDIHAYTTAAPFDAICADSFLGRFAPEERNPLIAKWHGLLRPGGAVITVNRVRAGGGGSAAVGFSTDQAIAFANRVRSAAENMGSALGADAQAFTRLARDYTARHRTWPVVSATEFGALFERAGFRLERVLTELTPAENQDLPDTPSVRGSGTFARIVAVKN